MPNSGQRSDSPQDSNFKDLTDHSTNAKSSRPGKARGDIAGGVISIVPTSIILVWAAYRQGLIGWLALRVWFALWEVKRWHEQRVRDGKLYSYDVDEILKALNTKRITKKQVEAALETLQALGIIRFSATVIWFADKIEDITNAQLRTQALEMLDHLDEHNITKGINFPRRILKFIIRSPRRKPVIVGTTLGLIMRCMLVKRYDRYKGCCKADWIAAVFGGDLTSISSARSKVVALGWFIRLETHQRVRNRFGDWFALALEVIVENPVDTEITDGPATEPEAPQAPIPAEPEGLRNQIPSNEVYNNQSTGVLTHETPPQNQPISWVRIQPEDLKTPDRREQLYQDVLGRGLLSPAPADKLTFFSAASHAMRTAKENVCGLFRRLIENPDYQGFISQGDEDQALGWLKDYEHGQVSKRISIQAFKPIEIQPTLSRDALTVQQLTEDLTKAGCSGNLFRLVISDPEGRQHLQGWTKDRWEKAELELSQDRLLKSRARAKQRAIGSTGEVVDGWFSGGDFGLET